MAFDVVADHILCPLVLTVGTLEKLIDFLDFWCVTVDQHTDVPLHIKTKTVCVKRQDNSEPDRPKQ